MGVLEYVREAFDSGKSMIVGLGVTIREYFQPPVTVQYPEEKLELPGWFRGIPALKTDLNTGAYMCTGCDLCAQACPVNVIEIKTHLNEKKRKIVDEYNLDMSRCMLCNLCVEACPFDSLVMANDYELSDYDKANLVFDKKRLLQIGLAYSSRQPIEQLGKAVKGKPPWMFAEKTGATLADLPPGVELGELSCFEATERATGKAASPAATPAAAKTRAGADARAVATAPGAVTGTTTGATAAAGAESDQSAASVHSRKVASGPAGTEQPGKPAEQAGPPRAELSAPMIHPAAAEAVAECRQQLAEGTGDARPAAGQHRVAGTVEGQPFEMFVDDGENLLDAAIDRGVPIEFDCKSGVCDTCRVQVLRGIENLSAPTDEEFVMLGEDRVHAGWRLSCQATVHGPVEISQQGVK